MSEVGQATAVGKSAGREMRGPWLKLAGTAAAMLAVLLMPPQPGLSDEGQRVLALVAAAVVLWATEAVPVSVSSLLLTALLMAVGGLKNPSEALAGFSSPILYFLIGYLLNGTGQSPAEFLRVGASRQI